MDWKDKEYRTLHRWIEKHKSKPEFCEKCGKKKKLELSNKDHTYKKNIEDYEWICKSCHKIKDNAMKRVGKQLKPKVLVKPQVIRKPDPSVKRKNIHVTTLNKIKSFLKEQIEPVFKSEIVKGLGVDYNSLNMALTMINFKTDSEGRIYLNKKGGKKCTDS